MNSEGDHYSIFSILHLLPFSLVHTFPSMFSPQTPTNCIPLLQWLTWFHTHAGTSSKSDLIPNFILKPLLSYLSSFRLKSSPRHWIFTVIFLNIFLRSSGSWHVIITVVHKISLNGTRFRKWISVRHSPTALISVAWIYSPFLVMMKHSGSYKC